MHQFRSFLQRISNTFNNKYPPPLVHLYYVAIKGRLASRSMPAGCLFTFPQLVGSVMFSFLLLLV